MEHDVVGPDYEGLLRAGRSTIARTGTAERAAEYLRDRIIDGALPPGTRMAEDAISKGLGISRNTLREAFRLLSHQRLLEHELNRGVFVRSLPREEVGDLYTLRRLLETAAIDGLGPDPDLTDVEAPLLAAERAAEAGDWAAVGSGDLAFHLALVALSGSTRAVEVMRGVLAELRLVFSVITEPRRLHEAYLPRNRVILEFIRSGAIPEAQAELSAYLEDAQRQLLAAYDFDVESGGR
ncbi:GntR family transcriptional regulator [Patulibacter americanus]|uniref:GntR family transcriptional regulator n=1 Tax=Patulibacter americanus TaxID=588672 RepID=UPI0003B41FB8|nr:GntR family transcriptional regulator [Patulibacter americanus]